MVCISSAGREFNNASRECNSPVLVWMASRFGFSALTRAASSLKCVLVLLAQGLQESFAVVARSTFACQRMSTTSKPDGMTNLLLWRNICRGLNMRSE